MNALKFLVFSKCQNSEVLENKAIRIWKYSLSPQKHHHLISQGEKNRAVNTDSTVTQACFFFLSSILCLFFFFFNLHLIHKKAIWSILISFPT